MNLRKKRTEFVEGRFEILGQHSCLSNDGHEVRIANPAGHNMQVEVVFYTGSSTLSKIHSNIKAIGTVGSFESELAPLDQLQHLGRFFRRTFLKVSRVEVRGD